MGSVTVAVYATRCVLMWQLRCGGRDEGIVFGVARLAKPRSKSASAGAKPGGLEADFNGRAKLCYIGVRWKKLFPKG